MLAVGEGRVPPRALSVVGRSMITPDAMGSGPRTTSGAALPRSPRGTGVSGCQGPDRSSLGAAGAGPSSPAGTRVVSSATTMVASRAPAETLSPTFTSTCSTTPA
jgi:hypothetical protein